MRDSLSNHQLLEGQSLIDTSRKVTTLFCIGFGRAVAVLGVLAAFASKNPLAGNIAAFAFLVLTIARAVVAVRMCRQLIDFSKLRQVRRQCLSTAAFEWIRGATGTLSFVAAMAMVASGLPLSSSHEHDALLIALLMLAVELACHLPGERLAMSMAEWIGAERHARIRFSFLMVEALLAVTFCMTYGLGPVIAVLLHLSISFHLALVFDRGASRARATASP